MKLIVVSCYNLYALKIINFASHHSFVIKQVSLLDILKKNYPNELLVPHLQFMSVSQYIVCERLITTHLNPPFYKKKLLRFV